MLKDKSDMFRADFLLLYNLFWIINRFISLMNGYVY